MWRGAWGGDFIVVFNKKLHFCSKGHSQVTKSMNTPAVRQLMIDGIINEKPSSDSSEFFFSILIITMTTKFVGQLQKSSGCVQLQLKYKKIHEIIK